MSKAGGFPPGALLGEERALDTDGGTFTPVMRDTGQCWILTPVD